MKVAFHLINTIYDVISHEQRHTNNNMNLTRDLYTEYSDAETMGRREKAHSCFEKSENDFGDRVQITQNTTYLFDLSLLLCMAIVYSKTKQHIIELVEAHIWQRIKHNLNKSSILEAHARIYQAIRIGQVAIDGVI